jgi:hypothetical protein
MAENTITGLVPDIYEALDLVSREMTGMIPSVTMSASAERAAVGQSIEVDVEPVGNVVDITPAMTVPEPTGQTSGTTNIVITKSRAAEFGFNGEASKGLNTGPGYANVRANKIAQAIRAIVNEVETDLCALQSTFSRAAGVAGTTPFATINDYTAATFAQKILKDNGGNIDPQLVISTTASATMLGKQSAVDSAGTDSLLRQGVLVDRFGMPIRESGFINDHTAGDGDSATTNAAGYAVGAKVITLASAGTGAVLAGDVVTFAGDTNQYAVTSGDADVSNGGTITLGAPGLRVAIGAGAVAITVVASSSRNMCFARSALVLALRAPALPEEGDNASDRMLITDPRSGMTLEFAMYKGYRKVRYEVSAAWGPKNIKPEHTALLLG